jgi:L-malate glycosyltransferase
MRRMLVICPFPQGEAAGQRLKYEQYLDRWRAEGWHVDVSPYMDKRMWDVVYTEGRFFAKLLGVLRGHCRRLMDIGRVSQYDLVYVFMWVTPLGTSVMERLFRLLSARLIFDVEDNVLVEQNLPKDQNPNWFVRLFKGTGKTHYLIKNADHVITSSPFLNDFCIVLNKYRSCTYVSSSVDTDVFVPAQAYSNNKTVTIGWTGTYSSRVFLDLLVPVWKKLAERTPFKLKVIGNFDYALDGINLEVVRWSKVNEVSDLQTLDIGVYPLPIDDWVLGKSGLKAIQYMAFGLPCVATNIGTTPLLIRHGENGILVKTEDEWVDALETLIRNPVLRKNIGEAARNAAVSSYSTQAIAAKYRGVINSVMEKRS